MVLPLRSNQFQFPGFLNCLHPLIDQQFAVDILDVELDRVQTEEAVKANFLIGQPFGKTTQNFQLSLA